MQMSSTGYLEISGSDFAARLWLPSGIRKRRRLCFQSEPVSGFQKQNLFTEPQFRHLRGWMTVGGCSLARSSLSAPRGRKLRAGSILEEGEHRHRRSKWRRLAAVAAL